MFLFFRLCELETNRAHITRFDSNSAPCLFINDVKWSYKEAIIAFSGLVTDKEKSKFSQMLKRYSIQDAKAHLLDGHCEF